MLEVAEPALNGADGVGREAQEDARLSRWQGPKKQERDRRQEQTRETSGGRITVGQGERGGHGTRLSGSGCRLLKESNSRRAPASRP